MLNEIFNKFSDQGNLIKEAIKKYCKNKVILDLGCGNLKYSKVAKKVGAKKVTALDIVKPKKLIEDIKFIRADAHKIPFKERYFDVIICIGLVGYVDLYKVMDEIRKVLKKEGLLILQVKDSRGFRHKVYTIYCKLRGKKPKGLPQNYKKVYKILKNNFKILEEKSTKPKHNMFFVLKNERNL